jgi:hypothetical protein
MSQVSSGDYQSRQIDFRLPVYTPVFGSDWAALAAFPGASVAHHPVRRFRKFFDDFLLLRRLDGHRFQRDIIA